MATMLELYERIMDPDLLVRRVTIVAAGIIPEKDIPEERPKGVVDGQFDLFSMMDTEEEKAEQAAEKALDERERRLQEAVLTIKDKFGRNAVLKGTNFLEGARSRERHNEVGGHKA